MKLFKFIFTLLLLAFTLWNTHASGACDYSSWYNISGGVVSYNSSCSYCVKNFSNSWRIPQADSKTFENVRNPEVSIYLWEDSNACNIIYGKDKDHVYYKWQRIIWLSSEWFVFDKDFDIENYVLFPRYLVFIPYLYHYKFLIILYSIPLLIVLYSKRKKKNLKENDNKKQS